MKPKVNVYKSYRTTAAVEMSSCKTYAVREGGKLWNLKETYWPPYWQ
jgi:hypothetical protein